MCGGFRLKLFVPEVQVDVDQDVMHWVLINEHKDGSGKVPEEFDGKEYQVKDVHNSLWTLSLKVQKCAKREFVRDMQNGSQKFTYVLVYPINFDEPEGTKNCVYVEKLEHGEVHCLCNVPSDPSPKIPLYEEPLQFYRVSCDAKKYEEIPSAKPGARQQSDEEEVVLRRISKGQPNLVSLEANLPSVVVSPAPGKPIAVDMFDVNWHATENDVRYF